MAMKASERRRAYGLKRIVVSQHNYMQLKKLGLAGDDSIDDVITNLLLIQRNYQKEKEGKKQQLSLKQQEGERCNEDNNDINNRINQPYSSFIEDVIEQHGQQMKEIFHSIEEAKKQEQKELQSSNNNKARKQ